MIMPVKQENLWDRNRGRIYSSKGGWLIGKGVINHGYEMMSDFVGKCSYMQVVILNATGKMVDKSLADWCEGVYMCLSWPDPRIWCNHIGALGGTLRTDAVAATMAGNLAADARAYGQRTLLGGLDFIQQALRDHKGGLGAEDIVERACAKHGGKPTIMGYARPIAKGDERVGAMFRLQEQLKFSTGEHLQLGLAIERCLLERFDESMNICGYVSAFLSDQGFAAEDAYRICSTLVSSGVTACYGDTRSKPAESFFPMQCGDIDYNGKSPRCVPD